MREFKAGERNICLYVTSSVGTLYVCVCVVCMAVARFAPSVSFRFFFCYYCTALLFVQLNADNRKQYKTDIQFAKQRHTNKAHLNIQSYTNAWDTNVGINVQGRIAREYKQKPILIHGPDKKQPRQCYLMKKNPKQNFLNNSARI